MINELSKESELEKEFIKNYDVSKYDRPSVTNDVIIFTTDDKRESNNRKVPQKGMQILLVKRDQHPYKDKFAIPGGFVHMDESIESGAKRILRKETGIDNVYTEQLYTFGDVKRDKRTRVISIANVALVEKRKIFTTSKDNKVKGTWFWINKSLVKHEKYLDSIKETFTLSLESEDGNTEMKYEVIEIVSRDILRKKKTSYKLMKESSDEISFDHYKIIDCCIGRLRNKIEYTPIAFNLLPESFTVKELQNVYETIIGRSILNFRRKMGSMIIETEEQVEGKPFRPAKMFKFNDTWEHSF